MARALAWQARGHRFESGILHKNHKSTSERGAFFMKYFVYIIYSESLDRYYVGHSQDLDDRMSRHKGRRSKYTKNADDWEVKYTEGFQQEARLWPGRGKSKERKVGSISSFSFLKRRARAFRMLSERPPVRIRYSPQKL